MEKLLKITFENKIIIPKTNKVIMMNINPIIMIWILKVIVSEKRKFGKNKAKNKNVSLSIFKQIFNSLEEVSEFLTRNAESEIKRIVEKARNINERFFDHVEKEDVSNIESLHNDESCNNEINNVIIDLGNGQKGNINIDNLKESLGQKKTWKYCYLMDIT